MDISFYCFKCGQHILIDEAGAGLTVQCPNCSQGVVVPAPAIAPLQVVPTRSAEQPPPTLPKSVTLGNVFRTCNGSRPAVHPWRRGLARAFDLYLFVLCLPGVMCTVFFPQIRTMPIFAHLSTLVVYYLLIEPFLLIQYGTTLGKSLLNIKIACRSGGRLSFGQALNRSLQVLTYGNALYLGIFWLVAVALSYRRLRRDGETLWDQKLGLLVVCGELTLLGVGIYTAGLLAMLFVVGRLSH